MENKKNIYEKLFEVKKEIGKVSKESENPFFSSKYMDINTLLEAVEPLFEDKKLMILQPIEDGKLMTKIINMEDLDEPFLVSSIQLPIDNNPQKIGSAITYYRRYSLKSLLGIQEEDDDGNKAAKPTKVEKVEPVVKTNLHPKMKAWTQAIEKQVDIDKLKTMYSFTLENAIQYEDELKIEIINKSQ